MLQAFTRNYKDESTEAGFQFVFFCDICNDGYMSSFIESETYKKKGLLQGLGQGVRIAGSLLGGRGYNVGYHADRATNMMSQRFSDKSPEWRKEHEKAFERTQNEAKQHFHRCPSCNIYVCDHCYNEDEGLCVKCAPRQEILVAKTRADAMQRNIQSAGRNARVWQGEIESKTTICLSCGKPAGTGNFCNNCGMDMSLKECYNCGSKNSQSVRFCNNCGTNLVNATPPVASGKCSSCGQDNPPDTKFCGRCGIKIDINSN